MTVLHGRSVVLRPTRDDDLPHIMGWQNHPEIAWWMDYDRTFTLGDIRASEDLARTEGHPFVIETDGRPVGRVGLNGFRERDRVCSLYVYIGVDDVAGRRLGRDAIIAMLDWGFPTFDLHLVELWAYADNARAIHTYEACGFRRDGLLRERSRRSDGRWYDRLHMSVLRPEFEVARDRFLGDAG